MLRDVQKFCPPQTFNSLIIQAIFQRSTTMTTTLTNPLLTTSQLTASASSLDGIPSSLEISIRYTGALLTQAAGILLRLPQDVIARAIVLYTRFWVGPEGGSLQEFGARVSEIP